MRWMSASHSPARVPDSDRRWNLGSLPHVVDEARLVGVDARQGQRDDQVGGIVGAVLRNGKQQERETTPRVLVETPQKSKVEQREAPIFRQEDVSLVRIRVVDAFDHDLEHVGAEELACELARKLGGETVYLVDLAAIDPLEHEHPLCDVWPDDLGDLQLVVAGDELGDELRVVRLLDEVEFLTEMHLELVGERLPLE